MLIALVVYFSVGNQKMFFELQILFDFLAFKNDVKFWSQKSTMEGLSSRTVMWRAFSQAVVFLYLLDEKASIIVLCPSAIAGVIEVNFFQQCKNNFLWMTNPNFFFSSGKLLKCYEDEIQRIHQNLKRKLMSTMLKA